MNHKILAVLMITVCMAQYSMQDNAARGRPISKIAGTPVVTTAAPSWGWRDWNGDGIVDWRDGAWGWNNGWNNGWAEPWGLNNGWRGAYDWNGDGIIDWRDGYGWNGAWNGGWNGAWNGAWNEPVVRRLGAKTDTASSLKNNPKQHKSNFFGNLFRYYIRQSPVDKALFDKFDTTGDGSLDAFEVQDMLDSIGLKVPIDEIEQKIAEAGGEDGRITFDQLMKSINSGM